MYQVNAPGSVIYKAARFEAQDLMPTVGGNGWWGVKWVSDPSRSDRRQLTRIDIDEEDMNEDGRCWGRIRPYQAVLLRPGGVQKKICEAMSTMNSVLTMLTDLNLEERSAWPKWRLVAQRVAEARFEVKSVRQIDEASLEVSATFFMNVQGDKILIKSLLLDDWEFRIESLPGVPHGMTVVQTRNLRVSPSVYERMVTNP